MNDRKLISILILFALSPFWVMTSCASSSAPASSPSSPASLAPILGELNLVTEPLAEKRLDVELVYSGGDETGFCYLGGYAMLAKFKDNEINFMDVIANSGIGTSAFYISQANLLMNGQEIGTIGIAAVNQGYDYYIAALEGAQLTDEFFAANLPEDAKQVLPIQSEDEAFILLRRLISSGIPVMVHVDISFIKEPLIKYTSYMKYIFEFIGSNPVDHYFTVTGYDDAFVYLNDPTEKAAGMGKDIPVGISGFLDAWENGNNPLFNEDTRIGPYWMLFLGERGEAKSADELLSWNKDTAAKASEEIRKAADNPNIVNILHCDEMYRARQEFGAFLKQNGYVEAGDMFIEASELFRGLSSSPNPKADFLMIADLQEQALTKW